MPDFLGYRHGGALDFVFLLLSYVHLDVITFGIVIRPVLKHGFATEINMYSLSYLHGLTYHESFLFI